MAAKLSEPMIRTIRAAVEAGPDDEGRYEIRPGSANPRTVEALKKRSMAERVEVVTVRDYETGKPVRTVTRTYLTADAVALVREKPTEEPPAVDVESVMYACHTGANGFGWARKLCDENAASVRLRIAAARRKGFAVTVGDSGLIRIDGAGVTDPGFDGAGEPCPIWLVPQRPIFPNGWAQEQTRIHAAIDGALQRAEEGGAGHWVHATWPAHYGYAAGERYLAADSEEAVREAAAHWRRTHRTPKPEVTISYLGELNGSPAAERQPCEGCGAESGQACTELSMCGAALSDDDAEETPTDKGMPSGAHRITNTGESIEGGAAYAVDAEWYDVFSNGEPEPRYTRDAEWVCRVLKSRIAKGLDFRKGPDGVIVMSDTDPHDGQTCERRYVPRRPAPADESGAEECEEHEGDSDGCTNHRYKIRFEREGAFDSYDDESDARDAVDVLVGRHIIDSEGEGCEGCGSDGTEHGYWVEDSKPDRAAAPAEEPQQPADAPAPVSTLNASEGAAMALADDVTPHRDRLAVRVVRGMDNSVSTEDRDYVVGMVAGMVRAGARYTRSDESLVLRHDGETVTVSLVA
jgi:hypothetical protein